MNKMNELKAAVAKISEVLGHEIHQLEIRIQPTGDDAAKVMPNGQKAPAMYFTHEAAERVDKELREIGLKHYETYHLNGGLVSNDYHVGDNISVAMWNCPSRIEHIAQLEDELAKLRGQEVIQ